MSGMAEDLRRPVVVDLVAEEEDELMRAAEMSAADIQGADIVGEGSLMQVGAGIEKEELCSSGATIPEPLTQVTQVKEEDVEAPDTVPAFFPTPVTPPPKPRHFEQGTPPEKKPKFPGKAGLATFGGGPLVPPLFAGPSPSETNLGVPPLFAGQPSSEPNLGVQHYHIGEGKVETVYQAADGLARLAATDTAAATAVSSDAVLGKQMEHPAPLPKLQPLGPLPKLPTHPKVNDLSVGHASYTPAKVAQDLVQTSPPPPWLAQVLDSLQGMHSKQDALSTEVSTVQKHFHNELMTHRQAIQGLQSAHEANAGLHETTARRILALEEQVQELRTASRTSSRTPPRSPRALSPRREGSRSPGPRPPQTLNDLREDLQIIVGGWVDARRDEIEREIQSWLQQVGKHTQVYEVVVPYIRCNHAKILLDLNQDTTIVSGRMLQKNVIESLKGANLKTCIPGQQENRIWVTPHRTMEERNRIKAVVSVKEFMSAEANKRGIACDVDLVWRGKVFMGKHQVLGSMLLTDPTDSDILLEDSRGDTTGWYLISAKVAEALRIGIDDVKQLWEEYLDTSSRAGQ